MVVEAIGEYKYGDKGNMTKAEIDLTIKVLIEAKKAGQFRAFWKDFNESVNLMASGETVIQSMWSPAVTEVRSQGRRLHLPAAQGRLPRLGRGLRHPEDAERPQGRARLRVHQLVPGRLGRRLPQPPGLLLRRARDREGEDGALRVGLLDGGQAGREGHPRRPTARLLEKAGATRDGGSFDAAHGRGRLLERGDGRERPTWSASGTSSSRRDACTGRSASVGDAPSPARPRQRRGSSGEPDMGTAVSA